MMTAFERYTKKTKRALFLEEMEQVVPWGKLCALIEPHCPKAVEGIVSEIFQRQRRELELEEQLRAEVRRARNATCIDNTLSNQCSAVGNAATR